MSDEPEVKTTYHVRVTAITKMDRTVKNEESWSSSDEDLGAVLASALGAFSRGSRAMATSDRTVCDKGYWGCGDRHFQGP